MKLTEEERIKISRFVKIRECPHCKHKIMSLMSVKCHLISIKDSPKAEIESTSPVAVYVCEKCSHIMMFSIPFIEGLY